MAAGDRAAATAFVRRHQRRVYGLACTIVGAPALAEEVAQEAFRNAWRHAGAYDARRGRVTSWLLTITRNTAIDAARLDPARPADPDLLLDTLSGPGGILDRSRPNGATGERLRRALRDLPREQGIPLVLLVFHGLTATEVAAREGIPVETARSRVRRAFGVLRRRLGVRDD
jgi:RNA polymerase sigma factor (sigma-70 family)